MQCEKAMSNDYDPMLYSGRKINDTERRMCACNSQVTRENRSICECLHCLTVPTFGPSNDHVAVPLMNAFLPFKAIFQLSGCIKICD